MKQFAGQEHDPLFAGQVDEFRPYKSPSELHKATQPSTQKESWERRGIPINQDDFDQSRTFHLNEDYSIIGWVEKISRVVDKLHVVPFPHAYEGKNIALYPDDNPDPEFVNDNHRNALIKELSEVVSQAITADRAVQQKKYESIIDEVIGEDLVVSSPEKVPNLEGNCRLINAFKAEQRQRAKKLLKEDK